jgi:hypothetical protein
MFQSAGRAEKRMRGFYEEMNNFPGIMNLVEKYGSKGPILTLESGAQVLAGQQVYVADLHIFTRLNELGKFDLTPILNDLRQHRLAAVIAREDIQPGYLGHTNWTPEMRRVVAMHYRPLEEYAGYTVYVPRETPLPEDALNAAGRRHTLIASTSYPNGCKATEVTLVDGQKEGIEREWNEAGRLLRETTFVHGDRTGPEVLWYENGRMARRADYACGCLAGTQTTWYPDGQKWTEASYEGGRLRGDVAHWDEPRSTVPDLGPARLASTAGLTINR